MKNDKYVCLLYGDIYAMGSLDFMRELFIDYVITHKMYGADECDFKIMTFNRYKENQIKV